MGHLKSNPEQLHRRRTTTTAPVLRHPPNTKPGDGFTPLRDCGNILLGNNPVEIMAIQTLTQEALMTGQVLTDLRTAYKFSQPDIARALGMHPRAITWREGRREIKPEWIEDHKRAIEILKAESEQKARDVLDEL